MQLSLDSFNSPIGTILLVTNNDVLYSLDFEGYEARMQALLAKRYGQVTLERTVNPGGVTAKITEYFSGNLQALSSIKTAAQGTAFQQSVWAKLREIPPANTWSYAELATALGKPTASRAVGMANSQNPIALVIPCHRVIGADGSLSGYAGGVEKKRWLLEHEKAHR